MTIQSSWSCVCVWGGGGGGGEGDLEHPQYIGSLLGDLAKLVC